MGTIIDGLRRDHRNAAELLTYLQDLADRPGSGESYLAMLDVMTYMTHYPDLFHHPTEELVFQHLAALDPGSREIVEVLRSEHRILAQKGNYLIGMLRDGLEGSELPPTTLRERCADYIETQTRHMQTEEANTFGRALECLQAKHWREVAAGVEARDDPLFGHHLAEEYRDLHARLTANEARPRQASAPGTE